MRASLEEKLERVNARLAEVQDQHSTLTEAWKVAQHKVNQSQAQNDRIEQLNEEKRQLISSISQQIHESQEKRTAEIAMFVEALSKIANKIMKAKDEYTKDNLTKELNAARKEYDMLCLNGKNLEEELIALKNHLESYQIDTTKLENDGIDRDIVFKILSDQKMSLHNKVEKLKELNKNSESEVHSMTE